MLCLRLTMLTEKSLYLHPVRYLSLGPFYALAASAITTISKFTIAYGELEIYTCTFRICRRREDSMQISL